MSHIVSLQAENFKRLKAVEIRPDGNTVVIKGRNAQGKSSVLDAIMAALNGKKGSKELVRPIRDGESKARVVVELDDLTVERRWSASGSTLTVSPKGTNAKLNSPQAVLDKLIGALSFDPLAFAEADPKSQVETLIDLIGREEFDKIAEQRREAYDLRTGVNRDVRSLRARRDAIGPVEPVERIDSAALSVEHRKAVDKARLSQRWEDLTAEINRLALERAEVEKQGLEIGPTRPVEEIESEMADAVERADQASRYEESRRLDDQLTEAQRESEALTGQIEASDNARLTLIARAKLPVQGLTFDDDGVVYRGVPFVQASAAERLKVSVGMAMALNPELKVICIRDASLLDDDSKRALIAMAEEHDYQIWYEVVGKQGDIGVIIEDGEVEA